MPGRNTSTSPSSDATARWTAATTSGSIGWCAASRGGRRGPLPEPPARIPPARADRARKPADVDVEHPPLARDDGPVEHAAQALDVGCRRHRHDHEVRADRGGHLGGERQPDVGGEVALVDLVEDHRRHARERGVVLQPAGQHAFGDDLDPRRRTDVALVAGLVADQVADGGPGGGGHASRRRPGGETAGLEHDDATVAEPRFGRAGRAGRRWSCRRRAAPR